MPSAVANLSLSLAHTFQKTSSKVCGNAFVKPSNAVFGPPEVHKGLDPNTLPPNVVVLNPEARLNHSNNEDDTNKHKNGQSNKETKEKALFPLSEVRVGHPQPRVPGAGMANLGNTCYLNSTLQALFHVPALFNFLTSTHMSEHSRLCRQQTSNGFTTIFNNNSNGGGCVLCSVAQTLRESVMNNVGVMRPAKVYSRLKHICKHLVQGRQEDAHEFLRYLIEALQRGYLRSHPSSKHSVLKEELRKRDETTTPFGQIFGGSLRQDVTCLQCKHVSTTYQQFMDLLLDIRQANTIHEALKFYFTSERIGDPSGGGNTYKCDKCKCKVPARKRYYVQKPPVVLCLPLKRFSLMGGKISKPVQLSRRIDIASFLHPNAKMAELTSNEGMGLQYRLVAMITHVGPSPNCGHYTAFGEAGQGQFYQFDDASVRSVSVGQVLNTASYVLFYEMTADSRNRLVAATNALHNNTTSNTNKCETATSKKVTNGSSVDTNGNSSVTYVSKVHNGLKLNNGVKKTSNTIVKPAIGARGIASLVPYDESSENDDDGLSKKQNGKNDSKSDKSKSNEGTIGHQRSLAKIPATAHFVPRALLQQKLKKRPDIPINKTSESEVQNGDNGDDHSKQKETTTSTPENPDDSNTIGNINEENETGTDHDDHKESEDKNTDEVSEGAARFARECLKSDAGSMNKKRSWKEVYEDELDAGKTKKPKRSVDERLGGRLPNPFQQHQDQQQRDNSHHHVSRHTNGPKHYESRSHLNGNHHHHRNHYRNHHHHHSHGVEKRGFGRRHFNGHRDRHHHQQRNFSGGKFRHRGGRGRKQFGGNNKYYK